MNNPLLDIKQILINAGITGTIVIDGFVVSSNQAVTDTQINIQSEPSPRVGANQHSRTIIFGIYNKSKDREISYTQSKLIFKTLNNYFGSLPGADSVRFHRITCITSPYAYGATDSHSTIYLSRYEAIINDTEISSIYLA